MDDSAYILAGFRTMTRSDVQGGFAVYQGTQFDVTLGIFELENPLLAAGGGHSPRLMGTIETAAEDMPEGSKLATGQILDVTDGAGVMRNCKIASWGSVGPLWQITLVELNQGA